MSRRGSKARIIAECLLLAIGFMLAGWYLFTTLDGKVSESYQNYTLEAQLRGEEPSWSGYLKHFMGESDERSREPEIGEKPRRPEIARGDLVGRIEIPRINVSAVVREGSDDKTLKKAAGHVSYTALPGDVGNVGIAAHRDSHFRNLRGIQEGDVIRMTTTWGTFEYEVESLKIVMPKNVEVLAATASPTLTLVTCYPFNFIGSAPKRFIVRARQVNPPIKSKVVPVTAKNRRSSPSLGL